MMETNRENILKIFPGLEEYWDKDEGKTFLEVFFWIYMEKIKFYNRWRRMKLYGEKAVPFVGMDAEILRMRLVADEDDFRPYYTEEQEEFWDELDDILIFRPVKLPREETCKILETSLTHKTTDEVNGEIMERWLRYAFEYKEHACTGYCNGTVD